MGLCYKNIDLGNVENHKSKFGFEPFDFAYEFQETDI